ncbi:MAG: hypothetical protein ACJAV1_002847, partial [Paraglaciecola sp.]
LDPFYAEVKQHPISGDCGQSLSLPNCKQK